jgi:IS1 family transposase
MNFQLGSRGTETGKLLYEKIKDENKNATYMTDYWKAYAEFLPSERHIQSKAETYTVEGYNSLLRHFLARLKRRTKCYSKSFQMLYYSLILFFKKWNHQSCLLN